MKQRFILYRRANGMFYAEDNVTRKQVRMRNKDAIEAKIFLHSKNESFRQPVLNLQIARTYLTATDPQIATRRWQFVMDEMAKFKKGSTLIRWTTAMRDKAFDAIRELPILETRPDHFLRVLQSGTVSTNIFLRRLHNFALGMTWLPWPLLGKKQWPEIKFNDKRAITWEEHQKILAGESNAELRAYYQLLWH